MKHLLNKIRQLPIDEFFFYIFILTIPFQLRTIINSPDAYIDYYFSYHLAVFFYISDLLFLGFLTAYLLFNKQPKQHIWPVFIPILWVIVNVFHVEQWDLWIYNVLRVAQAWIILSYFALKPNLLRNTVHLLIYSGAFQALLAIIQFHVQHSLGLELFGEYIPGLLDSGASTINTTEGKLLRPYGTFAHPNILGGFLAICLTLWLYVSRGTFRYSSWLIVSCGTFVLTAGLIASMSRSAWLAAAFSIITLLGHLSWKVSLKKAFVLGLILVVSCGTSVFAYKSAFSSRIQPETNTTSAIDYRYDFNSFATEGLLEGPLQGKGVGQYIPWLIQTHVLLPWQNQPPHNIILMVLVEIGLIGAILSIFTYSWLGFTWNNLTLLNVLILINIGIMGFLDHYLVTIKSGFLLLSVLAGIMLTNKKDVSQLRETSK